MQIKFSILSRVNSQQTKNKLDFLSRIKSIFEESSANIIHYSAVETAFPLKSGRRQEYPPSPLLGRLERKEMKGERKKQNYYYLQMMCLSMGKI